MRTHLAKLRIAPIVRSHFCKSSCPVVPVVLNRTFPPVLGLTGVTFAVADALTRLARSKWLAVNRVEFRERLDLVARAAALRHIEERNYLRSHAANP